MRGEHTLHHSPPSTLIHYLHILRFIPLHLDIIFPHSTFPSHRSTVIPQYTIYNRHFLFIHITTSVTQIPMTSSLLLLLLLLLFYPYGKTQSSFSALLLSLFLNLHCSSTYRSSLPSILSFQAPRYPPSTYLPPPTSLHLLPSAYLPPPTYLHLLPSRPSE